MVCLGWVVCKDNLPKRIKPLISRRLTSHEGDFIFLVNETPIYTHWSLYNKVDSKLSNML